MYYNYQRLTFLQLLSLLINKPKVVPSPCKDGLWSVRKLGIRGWKYLDLWNFKNWRYKPHQEMGSGFWARCCASESRAEMAKLFNSEPPVF